MKLGLKDRFSIVKGALYLILGICCVYLILTGRYLNYIAPRYELLLGISSIALILGGLATIIWAPSRYYKHNSDVVFSQLVLLSAQFVMTI